MTRRHAAKAASAISGDEARAALRLIVGRVTRLAFDLGANQFPIFRERDSRWTSTPRWNWASGHWIGLLWLAARWSPKASRQDLESLATSLTARIASTPHKHNIFYGMVAHLAGFGGYDQASDPKLHEFAMDGASTMVSLFNEQAEQIPIGDHETFGIRPQARRRDGLTFDRRYVAAVDVIHAAVPVLWRAWQETGDETYAWIARRHCERHLLWHVRPDGGIDQKTSFAPDDGRPLRRFSPLAATDQGCWARGLAWHIAGTAEAFLATDEERYRGSLAQGVAFYEQNAVADLVPRFDCLAAEGPLDTSAAAIAAWGLSKLEAESKSSPSFSRTRDGILGSLVRNHLDESGALLDGCYSVSSAIATDAELIWGTYYLASALELLLQNTAAEESQQ